MALKWNILLIPSVSCPLHRIHELSSSAGNAVQCVTRDRAEYLRAIGILLVPTQEEPGEWVSGKEGVQCHAVWSPMHQNMAMRY